MEKNKFLILTMFIAVLFGCSSDDDVNNLPDDDNPPEEEVDLYTFTLVVKDSKDNPVENAQVVLYDSSKADLDTKKTDGDGTVFFEDLEAEVYTYKVSIGEIEENGTMTLTDQDFSDEIVLKMNDLGEPIAEQNSPIIVTGYQANPQGSDSEDGGYEYVQLMALKEIDFSKTPYSVVIATNGHVTAKGWAEGGIRSFKMNLTDGVVAKGEFFYVGGLAKAIGGYDECGVSTDISDANWIWSKNYMDGGDGFGKPTVGLLGHTSSKTGANAADGIAVFEGTEVTLESVPLDAIFYGTKDASVYNEEKGWGYRVPVKNDLYSTTNPETGDDQLLYGQGTNTTFLTQGTEDNDFHKLGGKTSSTNWYESRAPKIVKLLPCPGESKLTDIEEGEGITSFIEE